MKWSDSIERVLVFERSGLKLALWNLVSGLGVKNLSKEFDGGEREVVVVFRLS